MFAPCDRLPWWSYETAVESLDDVRRARERVRSRLGGQRGVRVVDLLLIIDVLLTDAFDSGFAQRDLRLRVTTSGSRLVIALDGVDAPATIGSGVARSAGKALLDLVSTDWGVQRQRGRKSTWAALDTAQARYSIGDTRGEKPSANSTHAQPRLTFAPRCAPRKIPKLTPERGVKLP